MSEEKKPREITVTVYAPRVTEPKKFTWPVTKKVGEAAKEAAHDFGLTGGNPTLGNKEGQPFKRDETLEEARIHDHQELELLDAGGGV